MSSITTSSAHSVAVVGHKGVGKTALVQAMLEVAGASRPSPPSPRDAAALLDGTPEERQHAATLELHPVSLLWQGHRVNLLDTPGEASLLADTRLALAAADVALVVVSAAQGIEPGTERACRLARELGRPLLLVVTRLDEVDELADLPGELRARLGLPVVAMEMPLGLAHTPAGMIALRTARAWLAGRETPGVHAVPVPAPLLDEVARARDRMIDEVASTDDRLTERYLDAQALSQEELDQGCRDAIAAGRLVPLYFASAALPAGVAELLGALTEIVPSIGIGGRADPLAMQVFKTHIDPHAGLLSYGRVVSGVLRPEAQVLSAPSGQRERVAHVFQLAGQELRAVPEAVPGDVAVVPKLKRTHTGDTLCDPRHPTQLPVPPRPPALFSRVVVADGPASEDKIAAALARLAEEDPGLVVAHDPVTRELVVSGLGAVHLEITLERLQRRSGIACHLGAPKIAYRETLTRSVRNVQGKQKKQTGGHGQFAVCVIDVEPLPRGAGFEFEDEIVGGAIPRQFIPSVEKGIRKALARGVLAGFPVEDVRIRLVDGKYHDVDSSDAAFQVAGSKAFKAAAAAARPVLLEPIVKLEVVVPAPLMGDVVGDLNRRRGRIVATDSTGASSLITALVPLAETLEYEPKLKSMTHGLGTFVLTLDHLDVCPSHIQERVVRELGYSVETADAEA